STTRVPVINVPPKARAGQLRAHGISHIIRACNVNKSLDKHECEDLICALQFGDWKVVGKRHVLWQQGEPYVPIAALTVDVNEQISLYRLDMHELLSAGEKLDLTNEDVVSWQTVADTTPIESKPDHDQASIEGSKELAVLLAGHDFKFFNEIGSIIRQAGHEIIVDQWENHNSHDEALSFEMLQKADVIFCDGELGHGSW